MLFRETTDPADVTFESGVFLLLKAKAIGFKAPPEPVPPGSEEPVSTPELLPPPEPGPGSEPPCLPAGREPAPDLGTKAFRIHGDVPPEIWNRFGTKILPKLRSGTDLKIGIDFSVTIDRQLERTFEADLKQIFEDLGLTGRVQFE